MSACRLRQPQVHTLYFPEIFGIYGVYAIFSIRDIPWPSVGFRRAHVGSSGTEARSSNSACPGDIRILSGFILLLSSVSFRGLPERPCKGSGTASRSSNDVFPGNIRILGGIIPFWASAGCRRSHVRGLVRKPNVLTLYRLGYSDSMGAYAIFSLRLIPRTSGVSM